MSLTPLVVEFDGYVQHEMTGNWIPGREREVVFLPANPTMLDIETALDLQHARKGARAVKIVGSVDISQYPYRGCDGKYYCVSDEG